MKFKKDSDNWPKDSLERSLLLNFPGCKSPLEALNLVKSQLSDSATQSTELDKYKLMRQAIIDIELALNGIDIDILDSRVRDELKGMPLRTIGEIKEWKDRWMIVISRLRRD